MLQGGCQLEAGVRTKGSVPLPTIEFTHTHHVSLLNPIPEQIPLDYDTPASNPSYVTRTQFAFS